MQGGDPWFFGGRTSSHDHGYEVGAYGHDPSAGPPLYGDGTPEAAAAAFDDPLLGRRQHEFPGPLNEVEFQPFDPCPKNFVIFDQTYNRSRVMFHPSLAHKFGSSSRDNYGGAPDYNPEEDCSISHKEDTEEIDALLSSEEGEEDDVVSSGRTPGYRSGSSPDAPCSSSNGNRAGKAKSGCSEKKKERMKKMVRTLKGIIPGGDRMDTPAVLDEAVRYLKSLKVQVKKLGVRGSDS